MTFFTFTKEMADSGVNAGVPGVFEFDGQIIGYRDNATSLRVRGPNAPSEGSIDVQSYSGIFYNDAYLGTGTLKTRVVHGANVEMDMEVQSPHQLRLVAVDDTQTDGKVYLASKTNMVFNARADAEVASPAQLIVDRVSKVTTGVANTSNVELSVSAGQLVLASMPVLPNVAKASLSALGLGNATEPVGTTTFVNNDAGSPIFIMAWVDSTNTWVRSDTGAAIS